jgi:hypothetical protein
MKPLSLALIAAAVLASVAVAQTPPQNQTTTPPGPTYVPPQDSPNPTAPSADPNRSTGNPRQADTSTDVNDCSSQVKARNPGMSAVQVKEYCQKQLNPTSPQD